MTEGRKRQQEERKRQARIYTKAGRSAPHMILKIAFEATLDDLYLMLAKLQGDA